MKLIGILTILLMTLPAIADSSHTQFLNYLKRTMNVVPVGLRTAEILNFDRDVFEIDESLHEQLLSAAQSQSIIWGDTVLEGDVAALGEIQLDVVEELRSEQVLLGYRITYSQKAWDTSTCDLSRVTDADLQKTETFVHCAAGRIYESAYVTADLNNYFADYDALATLKLNHGTK